MYLESTHEMPSVERFGGIGEENERRREVGGNSSVEGVGKG